MINFLIMCVEFSSIFKIIDTHNFCFFVRISMKWQYFISFIWYESFYVLNLATYALFCAENLMIFLNFKLINNWIEISNYNITIFLPQSDNKMMLILWHLFDQWTFFVKIRIYDQIEGKTWNLVQNWILILVLNGKKTFVSVR